MKRAILFWFYKEPEICRNRLELLRKNNPTVPIYGLYGGDLAATEQYRSALEQYLDDFYAFPENKESVWKWLQGDLLITHWYRERGKGLAWDTVIIVQWDMLVLGPVDQIFSMLQKDQVLLSGLRPMKEVEHEWLWSSEKVPEHRRQYLDFFEYIQKTYDYKDEPLACLFIVACLPKSFLDHYSYIEQPELGFIEYRIPAYAQIFGISFCNNHPFNPWWLDLDPTAFSSHPIQRLINALNLRMDPNPLNPSKRQISLIPIYRHLLSPGGARVFHPYDPKFPIRKRQWLQALLNEFKEDLKWVAPRLMPRRLQSIIVQAFTSKTRLTDKTKKSECG